MGGFCTTGVENLPDYENVLQGTDIPEWVSAGGKALFEQAAELGSSDYPGYTGPRIASYGGKKLTPEELKGFNLLSQGAQTYDPYVKEAYQATQGLGQGYQGMSTSQLVGPQYKGATRGQLEGQQFDLSQAQPFIDIYQAAADPAVRQAQDVLQQQLIADKAKAVGSGAFGGSRAYLGNIMTTSEAAKRTGDIRAEAAARGLDFAAQQREADRAARFQAEDVLRNRFSQDREARFGAEAAQRAAYETEEASRLRQAEQLQSYAPLVQGLQEQAASGLLSAGEARRKLDQMALDLAYSDYVEQREYPFQMLNFIMGALKGVPYETTQYSLSQGQQYVQTPSIYGQTLGGLGSLASAYYLAQGK